MNLATDAVANLTLLFAEHDLLDRPAEARAAGFTRIEYWWPFGDNPRPSAEDVDAFIRAIDDAGVELVHMNLFGGDMAAGERGVISHPEKSSDFIASLDVATEVARRLGTKIFNVPYGHARDDLDPELAFQTAATNLQRAADRLRPYGVRLLLEAVSKMPQYPIKTSADAVGLLSRLRDERGIHEVGYLFDQYHLVMNGEDVFASAREYLPEIAHVQIADTPGRHQPGQESFDFTAWLDQLDAGGYDGPVALEFNPAGSTMDAIAQLREGILA